MDSWSGDGDVIRRSGANYIGIKVGSFFVIEQRIFIYMYTFMYVNYLLFIIITVTICCWSLLYFVLRGGRFVCNSN